MLKNTFKEIKKADEPVFKTPKSLQQTVEILKVAENGIFEVKKNQYSKTYKFSDINYTTANEAGQSSIIEKQCKLYNSLFTNSQITMFNRNKDMAHFMDETMLKMKNDKNDRYRKSYNDVFMDSIKEGRQGIDQEMYFTVTLDCKNFEDAKAQFNTLEATLFKSFAEQGSEIRALKAEERLKILHDFYHPGKEDEFTFDVKEATKTGRDFKNDICSGVLKYYPDHMETEDKKIRALFIKGYPSAINDRFLIELVSVMNIGMLSMNILPIPKDITSKILQNKYLGIEADILRQQRVRNRNNDHSSDISYAKRTEKKEIESIMDDVRENDQSLFYVAVNIIITADTIEELDSITETIQTIGKRNLVVIEPHYYKQREAVNTALPLGVRQVETMRSMLTKSLAALLPYNVQSMNYKKGIYYGINQISKTLNIGNRKALLNGNGFIFGTTGSGKSFFCKLCMGQVILNSDDDVIVIDPMHEYFDIARAYGGSIVTISAFTENFINPLEDDLVNIDEKGLKDVIAEKANFMLGVCDQLMNNGLNQKHHSIIDRCVRTLYMEAYKTKKTPIMIDFYNILKCQNEVEAKELSLCLELFVEGSLNIFNHYTNIDTDNRFTVYGIQDLGTQLAPVAMLVMMEAIQSRIIENGKKGKATWLYIDECHVLLNSQYSTMYLQQLWKKVRKQGGLCTGISQNVTDLLQNYVAATLISNSEFITILKQSNIDSAKISEVLGISDAQLRFVKDSPKGTGLIKFGNIVIPFDNTISKDNELYSLYNTDIHEKIALGLMNKVSDDIKQPEITEPKPHSQSSKGSWLIY